MKLSTFIKLLADGQSSLLFGLLKTDDEFYRACFISAALSRGVYENFVDGKASFEGGGGSGAPGGRVPAPPPMVAHLGQTSARSAKRVYNRWH